MRRVVIDLCRGDCTTVSSRSRRCTLDQSGQIDEFRRCRLHGRIASATAIDGYVGDTAHIGRRQYIYLFQILVCQLDLCRRTATGLGYDGRRDAVGGADCYCTGKTSDGIYNNLGNCTLEHRRTDIGDLAAVDLEGRAVIIRAHRPFAELVAVCFRTAVRHRHSRSLDFGISQRCLDWLDCRNTLGIVQIGIDIVVGIALDGLVVVEYIDGLVGRNGQFAVVRTRSKHHIYALALVCCRRYRIDGLQIDIHRRCRIARYGKRFAIGKRGHIEVERARQRRIVGRGIGDALHMLARIFAAREYVDAQESAQAIHLDRIRLRTLRQNDRTGNHRHILNIEHARFRLNLLVGNFEYDICRHIRRVVAQIREIGVHLVAFGKRCGEIAVTRTVAQLNRSLLVECRRTRNNVGTNRLASDPRITALVENDTRLLIQIHTERQFTPALRQGRIRVSGTRPQRNGRSRNQCKKE